MKLKRLEYFVTLAEELHFGRAAERLGIAQPPLSRHINQLEEELGARLFNRGRKAITLTLAGERLFARGQAMLSEFNDIQLEVRRIGQGAEGRLRIGFVGSATYGLLPNILRSFRLKYPEVNLSLIPMNNAQLLKGLIRREIDIAVARPALSDAEIVTRKLAEEPLVLGAPDTLALPPGAQDLRRLEQHNFILYPEYPRPSFADFVLESLSELGMTTPNRLFTMDFQTAISLASVGEGMAIVPRSVGLSPRLGVRFHQIENQLRPTAISVNHRLDDQGIQTKNFVALALQVARKTLP